MISLKDRVQTALAGMDAAVIYGYPRDFTGRETICWRESENRRYAQADGREYLAELRYALEIFACGSERAADLLTAADARMLAAGFQRENALEQFERDLGIAHVSARYRALADDRGNIYQ